MDVLKHFRPGLVRSAAVLSLATAAGCSGDAVRFQDGFYTGAVPTAAVQNAPDVDQVSTGSIRRPMGGMPNSGAMPRVGAQVAENSANGDGMFARTDAYREGYGAPTAGVTRSSLPLPPAAASNKPVAYQPLPQPARAASAISAPMSAASGSETAPVARTAVPRARPAGWHEGPPAISADKAVASKPAKIEGTPAAAKVAASSPSSSNVTAAKNGANSVTVGQGDSLNTIAKRAGVSVAELRSANGLATDNIRVGQALSVPAKPAATRVASLEATAAPAGPKSYAAPVASQPATATPAVAQAPADPTPPAATPAAETVDKQEVASIAPRSTGIDAFRWPVSGRVVKGFGDKVGSRRNDGVNISVPRGTAVKAAENGVVIYAGEGLKEFGKTVLVKHDNGLVTVYGNADDILVERGATVKRGQDIAKSGMTGETDVPVLHFEVRKDSSPVDPMKYLR